MGRQCICEGLASLFRGSAVNITIIYISDFRTHEKALFLQLQLALEDSSRGLGLEYAG